MNVPLPPISLGQVGLLSNALQPFMADPDKAVAALEAALPAGFPGTLQTIGLALLGLFTLLELYRLWLGGGERELGWLAAKVAIVNFLITTPVLNQLVQNVYVPFALFGENLVTTAVQQQGAQFNQILGAYLSPNQDWFWVISHFSSIFFGNLILLIYIVALALLFGLYTFAIIASRLFIVLAVLLAPILFPMFLWRPMGSFTAKWVSTTLHAVLLPLIGAIALVAGLDMGIMQPLQTVAACAQQNAAGGLVLCLGTQAGATVSALIGAAAAVFLMFGLDGIVYAFLGSIEVSTAGLIAARTGARMVARAAAPRAATAVQIVGQRGPVSVEGVPPERNSIPVPVVAAGRP